MDRETLLNSYSKEGDANTFFNAGQVLQAQGDLELAATAYDRAFGLAPERADIAETRQKLLNELAITEHGIHFRYIPAGTFLMGSEDGEADERPVHPVYTEAFYLSDVPISWAAYCDLMDWHPAPESYPKVKSPTDMAYFVLAQENKIRYQYCEDLTQQARFDWHAHAPELQYQQGDKVILGQQIFGPVDRQDPKRPWKYNTKPMVAVSWQAAEDLAKKLSTKTQKYRLPTEAEWEKAGRGGLIGMKYAWGDELPTELNCDFGHFGNYFIAPSRKFPPNAYGLYAICGGVWEWTSTWYDAEAYKNPNQANKGQERILRGGSWTDEADAIRLSFRFSRGSHHWYYDEDHRMRGWGESLAANIGFRLVRSISEG